MDNLAKRDQGMGNMKKKLRHMKARVYMNVCSVSERSFRGNKKRMG